MEGHLYVYTIVGRCLRCQRTPQEHVMMLEQPDPMTGCPADHNSVDTKRLIGDAGWSWSRCPFCNVMVEPKLPGAVTGPTYGPGRGDLTERLKTRLNGWLGWWKFNGGDA